MRRSVSASAPSQLLLAALVGLQLSGCPDTTIPTIDQGRTGRLCSVSELDAFRSASTDFEREDLWVAFVDVGQGDAIWIRTPGTRELDAKEILIDSGNCLVSSGDCDGRAPAAPGAETFDNFEADGIGALVAFMSESGWVEGSPIDLLVATHPDKDHYGGSWRLLRDYDVRAFMSPGIPSDNSTYATLETVLAQRDALIKLVPAAETGISLNGAQGELSTESWGRNLTTRLLSADQSASEDNNASVVLSLQFQGVRLLLMGDAEEPLDRALLADDDARMARGEPSLLASSVLKAGHHGGRGTNSQALLDRVLSEARRYAIISSGRRDQLPSDDTVARLDEKVGAFGLYRTDRGDEAKSQREAPGDDHILMRVTPEGDLTICYAYADE